jgi:hypothetical protein
MSNPIARSTLVLPYILNILGCHQNLNNCFFVKHNSREQHVKNLLQDISFLQFVIWGWNLVYCK